MASESRESTCVLVPMFLLGCRAHDFRHTLVFVTIRVTVRVDQDAGDLVDGAGLVDGDGHQAARPAGEVEERPLCGYGLIATRSPGPGGLCSDEAGGDRVDSSSQNSRRWSATCRRCRPWCRIGAGGAALHAPEQVRIVVVQWMRTRRARAIRGLLWSFAPASSLRRVVGRGRGFFCWPRVLHGD